jgi:hypothetical protein
MTCDGAKRKTKSVTVAKDTKKLFSCRRLVSKKKITETDKETPFLKVKQAKNRLRIFLILGT